MVQQQPPPRRFVFDGPIARPTLLFSYKIENMALGPRALVIQKESG